MKKNKSKSKRTHAFFLCIFLIFFGMNFLRVAASSGPALYLSPASGNYSAGETFSIAVRLDSGGQAINSAEGILTFDPEAFSVTSISKAGSIFNLWTSEPAHSGGRISFGGGTTANYNGSGGIVITITLLAKTSGIGAFKFASGSILAADGKGSNILSGFGRGSYSISAQTVRPAGPVPGKVASSSISSVPGLAQIISATHPDSAGWYADKNPKFSWSVPGGITGIKIAVDANANGYPIQEYKGVISEKQLENMGDGVWYLHLQLCNQAGCGMVSHHRFQIDTTKPEDFAVQIEGGIKTTNNRPAIAFESKDATSGLDYYEVKVDDGNWLQTQETRYRFPVQPRGKHILSVRASDKAGNRALSETAIEIDPVASPLILDYPESLVPGSYFQLSGTSIPNATIKIHVQLADKTEELFTKSDNEGKWSYKYTERVKAGTYQIWAEAEDGSGGESDSSDKITIAVNYPAFVGFGKAVIDYLAVLFTIVILVMATILAVVDFLSRIGRRVRGLKKRNN